MPIIKDPPEYIAKHGEGMRYVVVFLDPKKPKEGFDVRIYNEDTAKPNGGGEEIVSRFKENHPRQGMEVAAWVYTSWFENIEEKTHEMGIRELMKKIFGSNIYRHSKGGGCFVDLQMLLNSHQGLMHSLAARKRLEESPLLNDIKSSMALMTKV